MEIALQMFIFCNSEEYKLEIIFKKAKLTAYLHTYVCCSSEHEDSNCCGGMFGSLSFYVGETI